MSLTCSTSTTAEKVYNRNEADGQFYCDCKSTFPDAVKFYSHRKYRCSLSQPESPVPNQRLDKLVKQLNDGTTTRRISNRLIQGKKLIADEHHPNLVRPTLPWEDISCSLIFDSQYGIVICTNPNCEHQVSSVKYHLSKYHPTEHSKNEQEGIHEAFQQLIKANVAALPVPMGGLPPVQTVAGLPIYEGLRCPANDCFCSFMNRSNLRHHWKKKHLSLQEKVPDCDTVYVQCLHLKNKLPSFLVNVVPPVNDVQYNEGSLAKIHSSVTYVANEELDIEEDGENVQLQFIKDFRFDAFIQEGYEVCAHYLEEPTRGSEYALFSSLFLVCQHFLTWIGSRLNSQPARLLQLIYSRSL
jgi:Orsellinic acid/F9775 biosynthesis cluster protein D